MAAAVGDDAGMPDTQEIAAMFRAKREARAKAAAAAPSPAAPVATAAPAPAAPPAVPAPPRAPAPAPPTAPPTAPPMPMPGPAMAPSGPPPATAPSAPPPATAATDLVVAPPTAAPHERALAPARPGAGAGTSLSPLGPAVNLSDRLAADKNLATRGWRPGRRVGYSIAAVALLLLALERRAVLLGQVAAADRLWMYPAGLAVAGLALALLFTFVPVKRRFRLRMAATQKEEWARLQRESRTARVTGRIGLGAAFLGLAVLVLAYARIGASPLLLPTLVLGGILVVAGIATAIRAASQRSALQRLYVQTMVLARLESSGLGPAGALDPRLAPVLKSLDALLGALPESAVRRFLESPHAQDFLDLIDETREPDA